jgi:hypothetical protein
MGTPMKNSRKEERFLVAHSVNPQRVIPEEQGHMNIPESTPAIPWLLLLGIAMSIISLFHLSNSLIDYRTNKAAHKVAIAEPECPAGTRITIIEGGKKTCLTHHVRTYAASSILVTKTVAR